MVAFTGFQCVNRTNKNAQVTAGAFILYNFCQPLFLIPAYRLMPRVAAGYITSAAVYADILINIRNL